MKILLVHNYYQQPGGEDQVFASEAALLEAYGHCIVRYTIHNARVAQMSPLTLVQSTLWNNAVYYELQTLIRQERPQVAHFHNTFPLISPAAYYAAKAEKVPVIQTLHNYRLLCPSGIFLRNGQICEDCLGKTLPLPGVVHACYRDSRAGTGVVAAMLALQRVLRVTTKVVDLYIALTDFARKKFIQGGLPAEKIVVKPNFVHPDPGLGKGLGGYALFVGRLSPEKGIGTLLAAWEQLGKKIPLKIVGDGPLALEVDKATKRVLGVEWLGRLPKKQVLALMKDASILIFPSLWYEGFPMVFTEACATGLPVIASELGSMSSLITSDRTGLHFYPGNSEDLVAQVEWTLKHPVEFAQMRREVRAEFEGKYTAEQNYQMLMKIYESVCCVYGESVS
jgi:glycosyltransferase involved in cell wall biosynthesis